MMMTKKQWLSMTWYQMMEALHRVGYAHPETLREFALKQAGESPLLPDDLRVGEAIEEGLSFCAGRIDEYDLSYAWQKASEVAQECSTDGPQSVAAAASAVEAALRGEEWCAQMACAHLVSSAVYAAMEKARVTAGDEGAAMASANAEADRQMADALLDILPWEDVEPLFTAALAETVQGIAEAAKADEPVTRYAAARALAERGVTGEAAELLLAMRKGERAESRAQWALRCAIEHVATLPEAPLGLAWAAHVWAVLAIDAVGIGTTCKFPTDGGCTARFPAFAHCGKGRKQARDGGAWSAAIETAANLVPYKLGTEFTFSAEEEAGRGRVVVNAQPGGRIALSEILFPAEWSAALAAERLKAVAKALDESSASPEQKSEFGAWALVYNQALAEMARVKEGAEEGQNDD